MASRQEEKQRRREEREAAEAAAMKKNRRGERLQLATGAVVALAAVVVAIIVFSTRGGDKGKDAEPPIEKPGVALPALKQANLEDAAAAAGCKLASFPSEGQTHSDDPTKWVYKTNPPTSGTHAFPPAADDGLYEPGNEPTIGKSVHSLEHGRIDIQYKPGTPAATINNLETLGSEELKFGTAGYHVLVFQNSTNMPAAVAATAWTHSLTCTKMNANVYDAIRDFRTTYTDQGPEKVP